tara:strand:+ start:255 stop:2171 length:1917 start_codon:yes stop_codon:yes gene_type:complete
MEDFNSRIGRTVQAYSSNPKGLEKKYQMDKELADLIGLQTILSQQDAISRETMLRENQQEGNIKQQYEQKLTSNNQDGTAKRISELLASRTGQQPPATQGIAGQRPPMPQGQRPPMPQGQRPPMPQGQRPPMGAGIAGQPRPNMRMAAQGGIIGYVGGGQIDRIKALITAKGGKLTQQEMSDVANASKQDPEVIAFLTQNQGFISASENDAIDKAAIPLAAPAGAPVVNSGIAAATKQGAALAPVSPAAVNPPAVNPAAVSPAAVNPAAVNPAAVNPAVNPAVNTGNAALLNAQAKYPPTTGTTGTGGTTTTTTSGAKTFADSLDELGVNKESLTTLPTRGSSTQVSSSLPTGLKAIQEANAATSPTQMQDLERKRLDDRYGIAARKAEMTDEIAIQTARDKAQMDPKKLKEEERNAILRGMALGGVRGSTKAQEKLKSNTSRNQQTNMDRIRSMTKNRHAETFDALSKVDDKAATVWKNYSEQVSRAFDSLAGLSASDLQIVETQYANDLAANDGKIRNIISAARGVNEAIAVEVQKKAASVATLSAQLVAVNTSFERTRVALLTQNQGSLNAAQSVVDSRIAGSSESDKYSDAQVTAAKKVLLDFDVKLSKAQEDSGLNMIIELIGKIMKEQFGAT